MQGYALSAGRSAYSALKEHFVRHVEHPEEVESTVDPLTDDDASSPWVTLRQDETLRAEILQDVERCMPENLYFREPTTQKILVDVLFIFCKINRDVGYRQGMHELLAPILWTVERDAIDPASFKGIRIDSQETELMRDVLSARFIEHDSFTLFSLVMQTAKTFYETGEQDSGQSTADMFSRSNAVPQRLSPIIERSQRIHEDYLARADPALAEHLKNIDILPQVFLIRWIRLLFGREFPFDDLLCLWDALFAEDPALDLIDYICVVMLLPIRWQLMETEYSGALMLLLRYPPLPNPHVPASLVVDAMYLRDNLTTEGGSHLISKYTKKAPASFPTHSRPSTPQNNGTLSPRPWTRHVRTKSPLGTPARFIQNQGGIETLLQDAAKSVYSRGERWGVNKAVRDAVGEVKRNVQGLQSTGNSPRGAGSDDTRSPPSKGRLARFSREHDEAWQRVQALEERNQGLAQMLESAIEGLWKQRKEDEEDPADDKAAEAFNLAVAKVQFVKVYLEDSSLSLMNEGEATPAPQSPTRASGLAGPKRSNASRQSGAQSPPVSGSESQSANQPSTGDTSKDLPLPPSSQAARKEIVARGDDIQETAPSTTSTKDNPSETVAESSNTPTLTAKRAIPSRANAPPLNASRSSLANSSFSWMLGDSDRRSGFVPASSSPPRNGSSNSKKAHSGSSFLFGEMVQDEDVTSFDGPGRRSRGPGGPGPGGERGRSGEDDEEGFSMESLTGGGGGVSS
ncbi:MAG: hypothetical protein M4579_001970 [Chaenotheca gracillima]|nr:MAG: hypothetical protein M4579_001970 [Chaenotheca gracillima]